MKRLKKKFGGKEEPKNAIKVESDSGNDLNDFIVEDYY